MITIGDFRIQRIEEFVADEPASLYAEWSEEVLERHCDLLVPTFFDPAAACFRPHIQCWLVQTPTRNILIDTCSGNQKPRPASPRFHMLDLPWLERLRALGVTAEQIDTVICTHLHVDHVGWNTRLIDGAWVPTFPNARYVFPRIEVEWRDPERGAAGKPPATHHVFRDSVLPILEAEMAQLVEGNERFAKGIDFVPVPGHAPGQMAIRLRSGGSEALFIADVMHMPIQVYYPAWNSKYCEDPPTAAATRARVLDYAAKEGCLVLPGHFGPPHGGYVGRGGGGFTFVPSEAVP